MADHRDRLWGDQLGAPRREEKQAMKDTAPCKNCESRTIHPNCHANCERYKEFVNELTKNKKNRLKDVEIISYFKERQTKRR